MPTPRSQIAGLPALANQLASIAPRALVRIVRAMDEHDGFPTRGDGVGGRAGSELTSVERAAGQLLPLERDRTLILAAIAEATEAMHRALKVAARHMDRIDASALRCTGGASLPGALEWGRPECDNIAEPDRKGGLCMACRKRRDRWQRGVGQAA